MWKVLGVGAAPLVMVAVGFVALLQVPAVIEASIEWTCAKPSPRCATRMRAMGHVWSHKGDLTRAKAWYRRTAEQGDPAAMFHFAWLLEKEAETDRVEWLRKRAERGGKAFEKGNVPDPDRFKTYVSPLASVADWYRRSAEKGFAPAMNNLGELYTHSEFGGPDYEEAFRWHLAAARAGNPAGAINVALAYAMGRGVAADAAQAKRWSTWRAPNGRMEDLTEPTFGRTYVFGSEVPWQRRDLMRLAAEKGEPVVTTMRPMRPNPNLPSFEEATRHLRN